MTDQPAPIADSKGAPPTGSYTPALLFRDLIFVSGQGPIDSDGNTVSGTIEEETERTLRNVEALLAAAGSNLGCVLKCTCYLADIADFDRFDAAYRRIFAGKLPARTTVGASLAGIKVEIDAIAFRVG
jgi:2-iminobutanoate/2-iminopropanoate deaminase